jgi:hypothetical protein
MAKDETQQRASRCTKGDKKTCITFLKNSVSGKFLKDLKWLYLHL